MSLSKGIQSAAAAALSAAMLIAVAACGTTDGTDTASKSGDSSKDSSSTSIQGFDTSSIQKDDEIAALLPDSVAGDGTLTVGTDTSYAPAEFLAEDGKTPVGFDVDLSKALAAVFGLKENTVSSTFDSIIPSVGSKYDIGISVHNHPQPSQYWTPDNLLNAIVGRNPKIGSSADVGHWRREGLDQIECLKKLDSRIISLHFKDIAEKKAGVKEVLVISQDTSAYGVDTKYKLKYNYSQIHEDIRQVAGYARLNKVRNQSPVSSEEEPCLIIYPKPIETEVNTKLVLNNLPVEKINAYHKVCKIGINLPTIK